MAGFMGRVQGFTQAVLVPGPNVHHRWVQATEATICFKAEGKSPAMLQCEMSVGHSCVDTVIASGI
jgi:hypothetical protein